MDTVNIVKKKNALSWSGFDLFLLHQQYDATSSINMIQWSWVGGFLIYLSVALYVTQLLY